ncbi:tudor domain-containing protein 7-like [Dendronephthya gigantea]|uniref:tudor domain-containing protein 7-like n=1 Tax=Dendronephthya gigantea TaxID=151771 RepID=UPI00106A850A|nr:tudor domain-containing protein 7-like [Dendronephthya gigantea]
MGSNATDKEKLLRETEAMLRAVLISSPRGVRFEKLQRDFFELTGKQIPFKELGYPRLENLLQSMPSVARIEKEPGGDFVVKGVASSADQHVAKLISKQKKPSLKKGAKSFMAKRRQILFQKNAITPVRKPIGRPRPPTHKSSNFMAPKFVPPRMQRLQQENNKNRAVALPLRQNTKAKDPMNLSVKVSNNERSVTTVASHDQEQPVASGILENAASVKWIKAEIEKANSGLWATRLEHLFKEKFKRACPKQLMQELKFRPDITRVEEPIAGRFLLYAPRQQQPPVASGSHAGNQIQVNKADFVIPCYLPDVGASVLVYISHMENLSCFYVSLSDSISEMLSEEIRKHYKTSQYNSDAIPSISQGQIFCAQFTEDKNYYRARVLEVVDSAHVKVLYLDFGNKEIISVEKLRVLISDFQTQPIQAFECCLEGVQPLDQCQEWSEAAIVKFDELTSEKELRMTVHEIDDAILTVSLVDVSSEMDIAEMMKKAGLAVGTKNLETTSSSSSSSLSSSSGPTLERSPSKTESVASRSRRLKSKSPGIVELPDELFLDVLVCNITGTYDVYLRLVGEEYSNKLEAIQESMTCYYSDSKDEVITDPANGDLFALISDEVWCRVKVTSVNGGEIKVFFVDHGDSTVASKDQLRPLAPQFRQLPFQVFQCALNGLPKTKNPEVVETLKKLIMGEVAVAEIIKRMGDLIFIELLDTRTDANIVVNNVVRKLVIPDEELKPVLPKVGQSTDADLAYISTAGNVFLHVSAVGSKRLEELNRDLTEHYKSKQSKASEFISKPEAGKICCAKSGDGHWYRAKIVSFTDRDAMEVVFLDYGNTEVIPTTDLRKPTQENSHVLSLPFQALECQLYDVPKDGWSDDVINRIFEIVEQGSLQAEVISEGDIPAVSLLVTMESEGECETHRLASLLGLGVVVNGNHPVSNMEISNADVIKKETQAGVSEEILLTTLESGWYHCICDPLPLQAGWFDVYITEVRDADHFTFQLLESNSEITKLGEELQEFYQNQVETEVTLVEGDVVALFYEADEYWYRGLVETVINEEKAYIRFLDYGGNATVNREDVRVLDEKFLKLPFQGVSAKLAGVKCTKKKWSRESIKNLRFLMLDRSLVARAANGLANYNLDPSSTVELELCDTEDPKQDVFIAEKFIASNSDVVSSLSPAI